MSEVTVRALRPDDLPTIARIHCAAFASSALTALGREAVRRYYDWQLNGPHDAVALGATEGDAVVGFCFGGHFRGAMAGFLARERAWLARRLLVRPWLLGNSVVRERVFAGLHVMGRAHAGIISTPTPAAPPSFAILSIAVDPMHEGRHVGSRLMAEMESAARERGYVHMHLTVHDGNARAIGFYERHGWRRRPGAGTWDGGMTKSLGVP